MPDLKDAWMADRVPGLGKTFSGGTGGAGGTNPVSGIIAAGVTGTPPASFPALPEPTTGKFMPPPTTAGARNEFFGGFINATGFDGNTWLSMPTTTGGKSWSMSCWLNFGVNNVVGFNPTPLNGASIIIPANGSNSIWAGGGAIEIDPASTGNVPGPQIRGVASTFFGAVAYPADGTQPTGWFHLMLSIKATYGGYDAVTLGTIYLERAICCVNDTVVFDQSRTAENNGGRNDGLGSFGYDFGASAGANSIGVGGISGDLTHLYAAITELWERPNEFVDWTIEANRYKFHASDAGWGLANTTYVPVDIGPTGARPGFGTPRLYLTGGPSQFVFNRANNSTLTVNGDALVAVDDPPG